MRSLAIVIVNYNTRELLRDCLQSLAACAPRTQVSVWVVDNCSKDDSAAMVRNEFPHVNLIESSHNGGYAYANNLALRQLMGRDAETGADTTPDYAVLLNPDTVVPPNAFDGMIDHLEQHPEVGCCGPKLLLADGSLDLACRRSFPTPEVSFYRMTGLSRIFPKSPRFARYNMTYLHPDVETEVDSVVGACMMVRGSILHEVGLLDETFFMYGEDLDWAYRIKQYGWKITYVPSVIVHHYKRAASGQRPFPSIRAFYDAMRIFHRKHYAATTPLPLNVLIELGISLKEAWSLGINLLRPATARRVS